MESDRNRNPIQHIQTNDCFNLWRNWSGFWLIGLCNNFAYVVMLSAAQDILKKQQFKNTTTFNSSLIILDTEFENLNNGNSSYYDCSSVSTAAVLLADIFPTLIIKISAPLVIHKMPHGFRILFCVIMAATSFLVVSFSSTVWMSILGVIFASTSSGFGELTFLSLTVFYNRNVLGAWGSGTGGAGVVGALLYSILTQVGLSPQVTLLIMLIIPVTMLISYFFLLVPPPSYPQWKYGQIDNSVETSEEREPLMVGSQEEQETHSQENRRTGLLTLTEKLHTFKTLIPFVCALGVVYYAEYFINQGLMELLYFQKFFLNHAEQYRWYQTFYQVGVFISRSSLCCMKIRKLWGLALLQVLNAVLLLLEVCYKFLPNTWLVFAIIFYEGLLGGTAYVNTFYFISKEPPLLTRVEEVLEAISAVNGQEKGYTLNRLPATLRHTAALTITPVGNLECPINVVCFWDVGRNRSARRKHHTGMRKTSKLHTGRSGIEPGPQNCEANAFQLRHRH